MKKLAGIEEKSLEEDETDEFSGSTKDGHKYRAKADDQGASQYLKVFYGDGKYFRIYYDSNHIGGKAMGYDPRETETNDPKAEKVLNDLPDDFFKKYGHEGETGLEGKTGTQGTIGSQGTTGTQGIRGETGTGTQGIRGVTGTQGIQGTQGPVGQRVRS